MDPFLNSQSMNTNKKQRVININNVDEKMYEIKKEKVKKKYK